MSKNPFKVLREIIDNYISDVEKINDRRLALYEKEAEFATKEAIAFNILRQRLKNLEEHAIS